VSVGRAAGVFEGVEELSDFVLSVVTEGMGGWFIGRLETDLMTRCLSWAVPAETKTKPTNNTHDDRYEIFFKFFKTYTPKIIFSRARPGKLSRR